ncbi:MAG: chromosome segregation protein SMC [Nannocystaceae bacterium]|nr:chromosome segregation protein SMC [Nannocystaceae bacterium]
MRLKKIEVSGFKSFADRQVVVVDDHVTGIIGPNGCGKSNIVDAMRWCMGEQSAKHLRGSGMADVIFAGCSTRGPAGMAEVTLTFDNNGRDAPAHLDVPEIAITRRLFSDGTSEYLINKVPGRLRDITELLMGTGAGTKGYSIIEQGQVGRIVSSKPEERRHIIDEAAGITRFKSQKAAAQRKIDATRQNLLRVTDVVTELEGRLSTLRRQAQKAERYKRYREELRDLDLWIASHKFLELQTTGRVLSERRSRVAQTVADLRASIDARDAQIAAKRVAIVEVEQTLTQSHQAVSDLDNRVKLSEAEEEYRHRERDGLVAAAAQSRAEADAAQRGLERLGEELKEVQAELKTLTEGGGADSEDASVKSLTEELDAIGVSFAAAADMQTGAQQQYTRATEQLAGSTARREVVGERRVEAQRAEQLGAETLAGLVAEQDDNRGHVQHARGDLETSHEQLDALRQRKTGLERQRADLRGQVASAEVELDTNRAEVHRCRSRLQSLQEIQRRYRGCASGVQVVMEHRDELLASSSLSTDGSAAEPSADRPPVVLGVLADYLEAPAHLEAAVSAVLGDALEGVVVDEPGAAARGVELLKRLQEGRTTFIPRTAHRPGMQPYDAATAGTTDAAKAVVAEALADSRAADDATRSDTRPGDPPQAGASDGGVPSSGGMPSGGSIEVVDLSESATPSQGSAIGREPGVVGRLVEMISMGGELRELSRVLLGETLVVENLAVALDLSRRFANRPPLVTLEGDRLEPSGVIVGGSSTALDSALLTQKREIGELEGILEEISAAFESARARHLGLAEQLSEIETEREQVEQLVLRAEKDNFSAAQQLSQAETDGNRLQQRLEVQTAEHKATQGREAGYAAEDEALGSAIEASRVEVDEMRARIEEVTVQLTSLTERRAGVESALTDAKVAFARWQQKADAVAQAQQRLGKQVKSEEDRISRLREAADDADQRGASLSALDEEAKTERVTLIEASREATSNVHDARERFDALRVGLDEVDASVKTLRGDLDTERESLQEVDLGLREIELEREHVVSDVRQHFETEVTEVLIDFHNRRLAGAQERTRQKDLKRILSRLGEVNLTAIEEFEEVEGRYTYLGGQRNDLEEAIAHLAEAIEKINKTTRALFREAFNAIDERFQMLFPRLFNGGRAQLRLTDPTDMLETGVEIVAQPPGKQLRNLDLLSGGEKALTATSLIFAVFLFKPSPFCILDEVDAPLDDANVGRMCKLVRELSADTQFILITHNKVTMEASDRLYGVTMEQRGVSKLVSVNMRRAVEMAYN